MKSQPRIAVIGCGAASERLHLPALQALHLTPALLVDPNIERARQVGKRFGIGTVADTYEQSIGDISAAIVAVPHYLHARVASDLLGRGIHVLVEKPLALTTSDCHKVNEAAREGKAVLAVGLMRRFLERFRWVKAAIDANVLGRIESFDIREGGVYRWPVTSASLFQKETAGGGVLADTGAHTLDLVCWWFGEPSSIDYRDDSYGGVEADCLLQLRFPGGITGVVELSRTRDLRNTAIVRGERGHIEVRLPDTPLDPLTAEPPQLLDFTHDGLRGSRLRVQRYRELFVLQIQDWLRSIETGGSPAVTGLEGARSVALIEKCYEVRQPLEFPWAPTVRREAEHAMTGSR